MDNNVDTINLQELFALLWRNAILIVAVTVVVTAAVGLYTKWVIPEKYTSDSTVRIIVSDTTSSYSDILASQDLTDTYAVIAKSRVVIDPTIQNLLLQTGKTFTYNQIDNNVSVSALSNTDVLKVTVTWTDANMAALIANDVVANFMTEITSMNVETIKRIDTAVPNDTPVSPDLKLNLVIGFVLGLMLSIGFVLLREFLDRTIKDENDVEKYLKLPILGLVPNLDKKYIK